MSPIFNCLKNYAYLKLAAVFSLSQFYFIYLFIIRFAEPSDSRAASSRLRNHGQPGDGGAHPAGEPPAGRLHCHRAELRPGPAADRGGRGSERRQKLCPGKFRGQV